jgi:hypothetical protein
MTISRSKIEGKFSPMLIRGVGIAQSVQRRSACWMARVRFPAVKVRPDLLSLLHNKCLLMSSSIASLSATSVYRSDMQ